MAKDSDLAQANFDPITIEAEQEEVLINLIASILNLKKDIPKDASDKKVQLRGAMMQRSSYINNLEYKLVLALNYANYAVDSTSRYFETMLEYIENFYDQFDVISDLKNHLLLLDVPEVIKITEFARSGLDKEEQAY